MFDRAKHSCTAATCASTFFMELLQQNLVWKIHVLTSSSCSQVWSNSYVNLPSCFMCTCFTQMFESIKSQMKNSKLVFYLRLLGESCNPVLRFNFPYYYKSLANCVTKISVLTSCSAAFQYAGYVSVRSQKFSFPLHANSHVVKA